MSILTKAGAQDVPSVVRSILEEENFRSPVDNETNFEHCYNSQLAPPCKKSKTCSGADYVLELNEYADAAPEYEIDEVAKYILADFSGDAIANHSQKEHPGGFDIFNFWKEHQITYPKVSKLARWVLSIPASSASSERVFSCAGRVFEERRTRLSAESLDATVFLHSFYRCK